MNNLFVPLFVLALSGCARTAAIHGTARLNDPGVVTFCDSGERYGVAVTTANAAFDYDHALRRARAQGSVYVQVLGYDATRPSAERGRGTDRWMSVARIRALEARPDGC